MRFDYTVPARAAIIAVLAVGCFAATGCASKRSAALDKASGEGGGFRLFGSRAAAPTDNPLAIGVNTYLWRASLDVLNFMPIASADPFGGLIVTDWYINPDKADERFKVNVYLLDTRLRADGLNVSINRQTRGADGEWVNAATSGQTEEAMEDTILARARALRIGEAR